MPQRSPQKKLLAFPGCISRQGHAATAAQRPRHRALGLHRQRRGFIDKLGQTCAQRRGVGAHLQTQRALARAWQHVRHRKRGAYAFAQAQAFQAGGCQHDGVKRTVVELAQAGVKVAAQRLDAQIGPQRFQLHHPAQAAGADHRALRQGRYVQVVIGDKRVARVFALQDRRQLKSVGQIHRHVF